MTGNRIAPVTMVTAFILLATAAFLAGLTDRDGRWWATAVHLAILGALIPMIYAVNQRIVPVFSRRKWPHPALWPVQIGLALAGAVLSAAGMRLSDSALERAGAVLALAAGCIFVAHLGMLFRQPVNMPGLPLPFASQAAVDKVATQFSRLSGVFLLIGLTIGVVTSFREFGSGRWELVWAHALLLGCVVSMAASVTYHVLPRWTTAQWRTEGLIRVHFVLTVIALPLMLAGLATDRDFLLTMGGPLQALALVCWMITLLPLALKLPEITREAMVLAFAFLTIGISLGAAFAMDAKFGPIYRQVHAEFNVFGWAGFLILGAAYFLVPRFAGSVVPWRRLARVQFPVMAIGIFAGGIVRRMENSGRGDYGVWIELTHIAVALALASFAVQVALTFRARHPAAMISFQPRPPLNQQ